MRSPRSARGFDGTTGWVRSRSCSAPLGLLGAGPGRAPVRMLWHPAEALGLALGAVRLESSALAVDRGEAVSLTVRAPGRRVRHALAARPGRDLARRRGGTRFGGGGSNLLGPAAERPVRPRHQRRQDVRHGARHGPHPRVPRLPVRDGAVPVLPGARGRTPRRRSRLDPPAGGDAPPGGGGGDGPARRGGARWSEGRDGARGGWRPLQRAGGAGGIRCVPPGAGHGERLAPRRRRRDAAAPDRPGQRPGGEHSGPRGRHAGAARAHGPAGHRRARRPRPRIGHDREPAHQPAGPRGSRAARGGGSPRGRARAGDGAVPAWAGVSRAPPRRHRPLLRRGRRQRAAAPHRPFA